MWCATAAFADASQKLLKLSGNESPLLALFCMAAQNTAVDQPDVVKAFQPVRAVESPNCQDQTIYWRRQPALRRGPQRTSGLPGPGQQ